MSSPMATYLGAAALGINVYVGRLYVSQVCFCHKFLPPREINVRTRHLRE
jgi:hypothetical protein